MLDEVFTVAGALAIIKIIIIDILLAGDNAIVIGMAARNLPVHLQKKAIFWGTFGAIAIRLIMAFVFVEALHTIPYLRIVGGFLLMWIGYSLLANDEGEHKIEAKDTLLSAITTIVIADGIMGIDNVLGVVAAAQGHMGLVVAGMLITVPIIIWGSTLFIKLIDRFPSILYVGGAILGWVAAGMIMEDPALHQHLEPVIIQAFSSFLPLSVWPTLTAYHLAGYIFGAVAAILILVAGYVRNTMKENAPEE